MAIRLSGRHEFSMAMRVDRRGITRTVVIVGAYAFKVPCLRYHGQRWRGFLRGLLANMQERDMARTRWPELCPVVASLPGGFLVVMLAARVMSDAEFSAFNFDAFINRPDGGVLPVEAKPDSFGWIEGRIVALDYGGFAF